MKGVQLTKLAQELNLTNLTPDIDLTEIYVKTAEINRPALQLTGYLEHFANERVQIIGYVEYTYLMQLSDEERTFKYERFISSKIPCVIFSTMTRPSQDMIDLAYKYNVPTFVTERTTSSLMAEIIRWLGVQLAPCISIHGVLVDVYGEGVLITGESGIGKSEAALELIKRGHRLVSDDVVELRKVSDVTLVGSAPDITRHFIELRGIGIIDVKTLFGVESVKDTQSWITVFPFTSCCWMFRMTSVDLVIKRGHRLVSDDVIAAGSLYFHSRCACGCLWRGCPDHRREWYWQERGGS